LPSFLALPLKAITFIGCFFSFDFSFILRVREFSIQTLTAKIPTADRTRVGITQLLQ